MPARSAALFAALVVAQAGIVGANVEKTIFIGPSLAALPNAHPALDSLPLDILDPARRPVVATQLPVQFPSGTAPRGLVSWYLLRALDVGRRYEVRVCWPATQPTAFWLDIYSVSHVWDNPSLAASLADYVGQRQVPSADEPRFSYDDDAAAAAAEESVLLLRVQAAASYYSLNRTLMEHPLPVDVDIILDPFILNILPRSLGSIAVHIAFVAVAAWFLSDYIFRRLASEVDEPLFKDHAD